MKNKNLTRIYVGNSTHVLIDNEGYVEAIHNEKGTTHQVEVKDVKISTGNVLSKEEINYIS